MQAIKIFSILGAIWMTAAIIYGLTVGNLIEEAKILIKYPWFQVTLLDLYTGFALFSGWVIFRERAPGRYVPWIIAIMLLGNPITCLYALRAVFQSKGDWQRFWFGNNFPQKNGQA